MSYSFNKICRGALVTIAMLLGSVSTGAVVLIIKHAGRALQLSKDSSKHATQRTIAQNITFRLSKELEKVIASKGSSTQPFTYTFVNNSDPTVTVRTYSETPTDSSALNIPILTSSDDSLDLNSQTSKTSLRTRVTSRDQTRRNNVGRNARIIQDTITATSPAASSPTAAQGAGGYSLQVQKVYPAPGESKSAIYALLIQGYACDNGNASDGSCNSSSILGDHSIIVFKKRTCIDTRLALSNPNGDQLVIAADPGTDFYNLKCTCPNGKTIQADGTCLLTCAAGQRLYNGACQNCTSGSEWSYAGSSSCNTCNGCGTSGGGGTCDVTQGCTSCPAGRRLSSNSCVTCSAGTRAAAGDNVCSSCSAGTWSNAGAGTCTTCTSSLVTACNSSTGGATSCTSGYQLNGPSGASGTTCVQSCPSNCQSCSSSTVCTQCNSGWYVQPNASCAQNCPAGTYISGGICAACPAGQWSAGGTVTNCTACYTGHITGSCSATSNTTCATNASPTGTVCYCGNNTYWNGSSCTACYTGHITGSCTATSNTACAANASSSGTICQCNNGYTWDGSSCVVDCPAGTTKTTGGDAIPGYSGCYCPSSASIYNADTLVRAQIGLCRAPCSAGQKFCSGNKFYKNVADIKKTWNMGYGYVSCADCTATYCYLVDAGTTYYTDIKYCPWAP